MGCTSSKLDDLPAVALCRERCTFLDEAIRQRYALAEAHVAYMQSLRSVGVSLHKFFDQDLDTPLSHVLNLPQERKIEPNVKFVAGEGSGMPETSKLRHHSHSNSGSHLQFHDSDDDDSSGMSLHHSGNSSPLHHHIHDNQYAEYGMDHDTMNSFPSGFMQMNYMKNQATPSVSYEQRPMNPEIVQMGQSSYYPYSNDNSNYGYSNYGGGGGINNYFGAPPPYMVAPPQHTAASSSQPPPPMPPPESSSAWDIFNPFEYNKYYSAYTPSRDSKELREEEGIPDLEDDDYKQEIVKEVYVDKKKFVNSDHNYSKSVVNDKDKKVSENNETLYNTKLPSTSIENEGMEYEVHVVDKKVVDSEKPVERSKAGVFKGRGGTLSVLEVVKEIQAQFEKASESGNELAMMLEVGKLQYHSKHGALKVPSKMLHVMTPSLSVASSQPSTPSNTDSLSSAANPNSILLGFEEETGIKLKNLSSTLQKLYLWEKKLYHEVKAEEKMRVVHDRKCQKLKRLDEKGAESEKVEITRTLIRSLSTKIKIAIQVVDKISVMINKIRDDELWPLLNEFIQGLTRMWKSMLECHSHQCQAIKEARSLDAILSRKKPGDAHLEATMQLEHELINWTLRFSSWIYTKKGYIKALNNWLLKCIFTEPEETPDGIAPFSPGRIGAPPIFVICNQWAQSLDTVSEKEVLDSMRLFANTVLQFWDRDKLVLRQNMVENKDMEKKVRNLDKEDHKMQKEIQALEKKMMISTVSDESVYQSDTSSTNSFQACLQHIFEAMERYTTSSVKVYEEILQRGQEYGNGS